LGLPPKLHWATISCLALFFTASTSCPSAASNEIYFVWDSSKGKSTGSDHHLTYKRYYNLVCVLKRSNLGWPRPPYHVYHSPHLDNPLLATKYTLFGIVAKVNQPAQTIISPIHDTTTSYVYCGGPIWACCQYHKDTISCLPLSFTAPNAVVTRYTLFGIVAKVNQPARTITSPTNDTTTSYV